MVIFTLGYMGNDIALFYNDDADEDEVGFKLNVVGHEYETRYTTTNVELLFQYVQRNFCQPIVALINDALAWHGHKLLQVAEG